ncbi:dihydrodipicolinate synthase family protein [Streptomyces griseoviridis]|uniref:4-hydroxy-tetrahydrodipicolinate synthase n=3 Tax=Streptomyces TaxID=1883 RepID=A0ABT9LB93_STRGD|nr:MULTISPECIES: dihydrodipicolinate synthase family protein [Streptomyces]MDP9679791.1 4-hydroxy-tetrahydrodipicolinate synthase [Streptomyces griseoviridis]GGS62957.1 dihydrodipicolinate synthase family protein [Streptomyces niveoruber]GGT25014.1 dihydrodipicolinate synthase family protein [Streptomyces griseoviridis]GGU59031.1 dihydrodipicolinate synthase family protein [Streptomyces daghestanicus]GHI30066.1 dihydrodipicolinate synthase family protein [Streptomyces daghestanicus]
MPFPAPLRGVVPPVLTPLTPAGEVDTASLRRLLEHLLASGAHGLFLLGSSGEAAYLTDAQRRTVLETAVDAVAGRVPVLAGVIEATTPRVLERAADAVRAGADALVATAPFYARTHPAEIADHFRRVRAGADRPLFAYDIPVAVHTKLPRDVLLGLAADATLAGLKDSSGDEGSLRRLLLALRRTAPGFTVLTGSELTVDGALLAGADGVVPGLGNVDAAGYVRLYEAARAEDWKAARAEQDRLAALFALTEAGDPARMGANSSALGAFKAAAHLLGLLDCPATAAPQVPLDEAAVARVRDRLREADLL